MSDMIKRSLEEVIRILADLDSDEPKCPYASDDAIEAEGRDPDFQIYTLHEIAKRDGEPWASQVATDWLRENGL
jgi:hypothetical protein